MHSNPKISHDLVEVKQIADRIYTEVLSINPRLNSSVTRIEGLEKKFSEIDSFKLKQINTDNHLAQTDKRHDQIDSKNRQLLEEFNNLKKDFVKQRDLLNECLNEYKNFKYVVSKLKLDMDAEIATLLMLHKNSLEDMKREFQSAIKTIKNDLAVTPKQIFEQNESVAIKLKKATEDSGTALTITQKFSNAIYILGKKIESINLELAKLQR